MTGVQTCALPIWEKIAELRKKKGLTQVQFAKKLKIQRTALTRIELGKTNYTIKSLRNIAKELEISIEELVDRKSTRLNSSHTDISRMPSSA